MLVKLDPLGRGRFGACGFASNAVKLQGNKESLMANTFMLEVEKSVANPKEFVLAQLAKAGIPEKDVQVRLEVNTHNYKGVSFVLPRGDSTEEVIQSLPAISAFRVQKRSFLKPKISEFNTTAFPLEQFHALTGVNEVRQKYGLSGKNIKHPALGGGFGPGFKVAYGHDFVGDAYGIDDTTSTRTLTPLTTAQSQESDLSCLHGTHVAGIVAAYANKLDTTAANIPPADFTGVAPNAIIGAYRFGCPADNTGTDVIAAAIYRAACPNDSSLAQEDGSHVINLSLGGGAVYNDGADAYAAETVAKSGHIVVAANGNSQSSGIMTAGSPGIARKAFGVASFDNAVVVQSILTVDGQRFPYSTAQANSSFAYDTPYEIIANSMCYSQTLTLKPTTSTMTVSSVPSPTPLAKPSSSVGVTSVDLVVVAATAFAAGAVACIIYSDSASIPGIRGFASLPGLATSNDAGKALIAAIKAGQKPVFAVTTNEALFPVPTAGTVSDFSSPGLDPELFIKPDIGGIGGEVLSTISPFAAAAAKKPYNYGVYSGTSMATPYFAGVLALFLESKGNLPFETVMTYMQNTAKPAKIYNSDLVDSVTRQGAGLVNVLAALSTKTLVTPSALHLNDTEYAKLTHVITVKNLNTKEVKYTLSSLGAAMATPFIAGDDAMQMISNTPFTADYAEVKFTKNNGRVDTLDITVPAGGSKEVRVHFNAPSNANPKLYPIYSGYVAVSYQGEKETIATIPYAGMVGRWRDAPIWAQKSDAYGQGYFNGLLDVDYKTIESLTGAYIPGTTEDTIVPVTSDTVFTSGSDMTLIPIPATSSRYAKVEVVFVGTADEKKTLPGSIRHKTPLGYALVYTEKESIPASFSEVPRVTPGTATEAPSQYIWRGEVVTNSTSVEEGNTFKLPTGSYQLKFSALNHWGRVGAKGGDKNYDVVSTATFRLI
ncbi:peptidase S8/S53 domain-containing protein [Chytridium lagenaria]|nr:peptidase S8/S53 domain-containing protein [Chytridium lagenaria]